jgi:glycosyltransferase involved in cell wall biosynthesis
MSYLIFCSFEVGGLPYRMAEILNAQGVAAYYASIARPNRSHDSTQFHYGRPNAPWDLTPRFRAAMGSRKKIKSLLSQVRSEFHLNHIFATGPKAYLLREAGLPYHYWSYGSDLDYQVKFIPVLPQSYSWWTRPPIYFRMLQLRREARRAITNATAVMIAPYQIGAYLQVCPDKPLFFLPHFFKLEDWAKLGPKRLASTREMEAKIGGTRFFFSSTRHIWSGPWRQSADNKGNDLILSSFKEYLDLSGDQGAKLVLVDKGPDVGASRALARELNISPQVVWVEEMKRAQLDQYYQGAALCFGQFGTPVLAFTALEPLAQANISISAFARIDSRVPFYPEDPPIFKSKEPREIAAFMAQMVAQPQQYADLCRRSWEWIKENCTEERFAAEFVKSFSRDLGAGSILPENDGESRPLPWRWARPDGDG